MRTPEENWRRSRGVMLGPGIGLAAGIVVTVFTKDFAPTGVVFGIAMSVGLVLGIIYDLLARRRKRQAESRSVPRND